MKYFEKIDGLRFVAISLVLIEHFASGIGKHISAGYYGVDLFFVISGFLITGILIKPNNQSFKHNYINFLGRRMLRIFPIYYLTLAILWVVNMPFTRDFFGYFITYTFNYTIVAYHLPTSPVFHFWSLCVEEQFYLFWPFLAITLRKKLWLLLGVTMLIIFLGYAQQCFSIIPSIAPYNYFGLLTRMASLGLGASAAILLAKDLLPSGLLRNKFFEYFMLAALPACLISSFLLKGPALGLCSAYLVLKSAHYGFNINFINRGLTNKKVLSIGRISYGIYIFHLPIGYTISKFLFNPFWESLNFKLLGRFQIIHYNAWIIKFPIYALISIGVASISFKYIERPFLAMKDRFFRKEFARNVKLIKL